VNQSINQLNSFIHSLRCLLQQTAGPAEWRITDWTNIVNNDI